MYLILFSIGKLNLLMLKLIILLIPIHWLPIQESISDNIPKPIFEYWNWDNWDLFGQANTKTVNSKNFELLRLNAFNVYGESFERQKNITGQYRLPLNGIENPSSISFEFLTLNHVNQPIGFELVIQGNGKPTVSFTSWDREAAMAHVYDFNWQKQAVNMDRFKKYWSHVVLVFTSNSYQVYINGEVKIWGDLKGDFSMKNTYLNAFLENEPYMELGDLIKQVAAYDTTLTPNLIQARFDKVKDLIDHGKLYPDQFHYNSFPYLNHIQPNQASVSWETNETCTTEILFGTSNALERSITIENKGQLIQNAVLDGLLPETTYYYQLKSENAKGDTLSTALLTFQTTKMSNKSFLFGIVSDTESRPQINRRVGELLWDERPDFLIHLGDLTDGGHQNHKFEWNMEYFQGLGPLTSRIPIFTVPGNGDADLFWYQKYHPHYGKKGEAYYRFDYGQVSFWMLNSNQKKELQSGGRQYEWLENELKQSQSKWKFVALHHAPYSADENDYGNTWIGQGDYGDKELKDLINLMEDNSVDMVFFGHLHTYMRTHPLKNNMIDQEKGVVYVQAGGTGGNLEDNGPTRTWFSAKTFRGFHYCTVQLLEDYLELRTYNLEGGLIDYYNFDKVQSIFSKK
jgi:predicted phosphodiesterase